MASLALIVSLIFLSVLLSGPLCVLLHAMNFKILAKVLAVFAILAGLWWFFITIFPISIIGAISAILGARTILKK